MAKLDLVVHATFSNDAAEVALPSQNKNDRSNVNIVTGLVEPSKRKTPREQWPWYRLRVLTYYERWVRSKFLCSYQ